MDQATLFDHCIIYTNEKSCSKPSPKFNGLCVDHDTSSAFGYQPFDHYYCNVFKPKFAAQIKAMLGSIEIVGKSKDKVSITNALFYLASKHKHFIGTNIKTKTTLKNKIIELSQNPVPSLTQTENDALVQNMKTHYRNIFPYDCHEFNL